MCRIAGIFNRVSDSSLSLDIVRMRESMQHGGPDDAGVYLDEDLPLALGHRRLSLIDLSAAGHQPMSDLLGMLQLIFNGEIYNYQEIKATLSALGHVFKTKSDTEVILKAYLQWGTKCFGRFNGMFALAMWDKRSNQLILARDHAGIKPLYYFVDKDLFIFASEIRAFKAYKCDWPETEDWKIPFLTFGHLPEPFTTLQNVKPLAKGTCLIVELPSLKATESTFSTFQFSSLITDAETAVALVKEKLEKAVERHLISDAPIGLFLSGGVDSSLLTLIAHKYIGESLKTLSIVFEDATLNEEPYQNIIIDQTNAHHQSFLVTEKDFRNELPDILEAMDQPSTDGINSYFICKYARQYGLTAVLSGLGADELFGGYNSFNHASKAAFIQKLPSFIPGLANHLPKEKLKKIAFLERKDIVGEYLFNRGLFSINQTASLLSISEREVNNTLDKVLIEPIDKSVDHRNRASHLEVNLYMKNQLLKDSDTMSMWHSLEVRVPFLDKELMETAYSIHPDIKFDKKIGKHLLIKAFDEVLPKKIWQRKKQGFTFPFYKWMKDVQLESRNDQYRKLRNLFEEDRLLWARYWAYLICNKNAGIKCFAPGAPKVLFLNLAAFSTTGGIEKFNRAFLKALTEIQVDGLLVADSLSMYDKESNEAYFKKSNYGTFSNKVKFVFSLIKNAKKYDVIIAGHINLAKPIIAARLLNRTKKIILVTHGIEVWEVLHGKKSELLHGADKIIAVSNFTKNKIVQQHQIDTAKVSVLHNTIDPYFKYPDQFTKPQYLKDRYNLNGQKVISTLTRLSSSEQYKGYDKVLEVLPEIKKKIPGIKYIISGKADDAEMRRVQSLIKTLGLENNVILTGFVEDSEVIDHYLLSDAFIMPSTMEGFGIVFIEAMACGLPVIAGNVDGSVDALNNGELGKLVDPSNNEQIIASVCDYLPSGKLLGYELQQKVIVQFGFNSFKNKIKSILLES